MSSALRNLSNHFLCGVPVQSLDVGVSHQNDSCFQIYALFVDRTESFFGELCQFQRTAVLQELVDEKVGLENQNTLLSLTVDHPLVLKHPLKYAYQQIFLRTILKELEIRGADICDLLYTRHCELLSTSAPSDTGFRHYVLADGTIISIRESTSLVSNGTTGLCTWQASAVLVNWCADSSNATLFKGARVLELGSGVGLSGLSICHLCQPDFYCFSDCHHAVLNALVYNIQLNAKGESETSLVLPEIEERMVWRGKHGVSSLAVLNLPWEDVVDENAGKILAPDVVVASDVVYDKSIFDPLSAAVQHFALVGSKIVLACTERNPETLKDFLELLGSLDLSVKEEQVPETSAFLTYSDSSVKIYLISSK